MGERHDTDEKQDFWRTGREPRAISEQERHKRHCNHAHKCNVTDTLRSKAFSDGVTSTWRVPKTGLTNDSIPKFNTHNSIHIYASISNSHAYVWL